MKLAFYTDPGHGWLAVSVQHLQQLQLVAQISAYSYISRDGRTAYLEEDCDMSRYLRACELAGIQVRLDQRHSNFDAWIRELPRFTPEGCQA